jgi:ribosomal protein S18 acetylase RimI-like enzyme
MNVQIRDAVADDLDRIASNNLAMALETERKALDAATVRLGVGAVLADRTRGRYFLAVDDTGAVLGQLMLTHEWSDWRNGDFWWIQSVYVEPAARRHGVFRALYAHVERLARAAPRVCGLRLYVENENQLAQRTYASCGMRDAGYRVMEVDHSGAVRAPLKQGDESC